MREGIVRLVATRGLPSSRLVQHVTGEVRPPTAYVRGWLGVGVEILPREGLQPDISIDPVAMDRMMRGVELAGQIATRMDSKKRGGKPANLGMSVLFTGGPPVNDVHANESTIPDDAPATLAQGRPWTIANCRDFARECRSLVCQALPGARWVLAMHMDETSVHVHGEMPAFVRQTNGTFRIGNVAVREGLARLAPKYDDENERVRQAAIAKEAKALDRDVAAVAAGRKPRRRRFIDKGPDAIYLGAQAQMRLAHDAYAHQMARFGIERGKGGGKAYTQAINRGAGMRAKLEAQERDRREAEDEAEAARLQAALARAGALAIDSELREREDRAREDREAAETTRREATAERAATGQIRAENEASGQLLRQWTQDLQAREAKATKEREAAEAERGRAEDERDMAERERERAEAERDAAEVARMEAHAAEERAREDREAAKAETAKATAERTEAAQQLADAQRAQEQARLDREAAAEERQEVERREEAVGWAKYHLQCKDDDLGSREAIVSEAGRSVAREREAAVKERRTAESVRGLADTLRKAASYEWDEATADRDAAAEERRVADELYRASDGMDVLVRLVEWVRQRYGTKVSQEMHDTIAPADDAQRRDAQRRRARMHGDGLGDR